MYDITFFCSLSGTVVNINLCLGACVCYLLFFSWRQITGTASWVSTACVKLQAWRSYGSSVGGIKVTAKFLWVLLGVLTHAAALGLGCHSSPLPSKVECWASDALWVSWIQQDVGAVLLHLWQKDASFFWLQACLLNHNQDKSVGIWGARRTFP